MKDYSGLLEIADASIGKNDDQQLKQDTEKLRALIGNSSDAEQQAVANAIGQRILKLH